MIGVPLYKAMTMEIKKRGVPKKIYDIYFVFCLVTVLMFKNYYLLIVFFILHKVLKKISYQDDRLFFIIKNSSIKKFYNY